RCRAACCRRRRGRRSRPSAKWSMRPLDRGVARWKRRVTNTSIRRAAMNITKDQLTKEVGGARKNGWLPILTKAEKRHNLPAGLLLAIASRETDMQDVVGDGGHGRGLFQIDDRSHGDFLAQQKAAGPGGKPPVAAAADYAANLLASNLGYGQ